MDIKILDNGFIPESISEILSSDFQDVEEVANQLPKILANEHIESSVKSINPNKDISNLSDSELERAMLLYSYIGHAYMWGKKEVHNVIPKELAITWHSIAKKLDRPPILSYASYALNNWKILDPSKPFDVENINILQNFLGGVDEDWFIMIHVAIEYEAKNLLSNLKTYFLERSENIQQLEDSYTSIKKINSIMNRMPEKCDPFIYYNRVRPYIFGWKNNPATPEGVVYEGVDEYNNQPQLFRGETGAQSSIVPCLDAFLGVTHSNDPLREYLDEMRLYMPKNHRDILNYLDEWSQSERGELELHNDAKQIVNSLIDEVHKFRNKHLEYARVYIFEQSLTKNSNSNIVGTGGTPFMKYLYKHLQETMADG